MTTSGHMGQFDLTNSFELETVQNRVLANQMMMLMGVFNDDLVKTIHSRQQQHLADGTVEELPETLVVIICV